MSRLPHHPFLDRFEAVERLRAWMRETGKTIEDVEAADVSRAEFQRLLDQGTTGRDGNAFVLTRLICAWRPLGDYVVTGGFPQSTGKREKLRLKLWELVEGFSGSMELKGGDAKSFAVWVMRRLEEKLNGGEFAVYDRGLPKTEMDLETYYVKWTKSKGR